MSVQIFIRAACEDTLQFRSANTLDEIKARFFSQSGIIRGGKRISRTANVPRSRDKFVSSSGSPSRRWIPEKSSPAFWTTKDRSFMPRGDVNPTGFTENQPTRDPYRESFVWDSSRFTFPTLERCYRWRSPGVRQSFYFSSCCSLETRYTNSPKLRTARNAVSQAPRLSTEADPLAEQLKNGVSTAGYRVSNFMLLSGYLEVFYFLVGCERRVQRIRHTAARHALDRSSHADSEIYRTDVTAFRESLHGNLQPRPWASRPRRSINFRPRETRSKVENTRRA